MSSVFFSYTHESRDLARSLATAMEELGIKVVDPTTDIRPGDNWKNFIKDSIRDSAAMVVVVGRESNSSGLSYETGVAEALDKPIFIVHPDSVDPLRLPRHFRTWQMLTVAPSHVGSTAKDLAEALV